MKYQGKILYGHEDTSVMIRRYLCVWHTSDDVVGLIPLADVSKRISTRVITSDFARTKPGYFIVHKAESRPDLVQNAISELEERIESRERNEGLKSNLSGIKLMQRGLQKNETKVSECDVPPVIGPWYPRMIVFVEFPLGEEPVRFGEYLILHQSEDSLYGISTVDCFNPEHCKLARIVTKNINGAPSAKVLSARHDMKEAEAMLRVIGNYREQSHLANNQRLIDCFPELNMCFVQLKNMLDCKVGDVKKPSYPVGRIKDRCCAGI